MGIFCKAHGGGGNREGRDKNHFPQEKKGEEASPRMRIKGLAKVDVRSARTRHRGTKFRVYHPITNREQSAEEPTKYGLGAAHRRENHADGDEGPDADHLQHVDRGGLNQPHAPNEFVGRACDFRREVRCRVFGQARSPG